LTPNSPKIRAQIFRQKTLQTAVSQRSFSRVKAVLQLPERVENEKKQGSSGVFRAKVVTLQKE
jgi:hypothetical protein